MRRTDLRARRAGLLALGLGVGLAGCHGDATPAWESLTAVRVQPVQRPSLDAAARYAAVIEPASRVDLAFKVSGYIDSIGRAPGIDGKPRLLQEGDRVSRGRELAAVRRVDYQHKLSEAEAAAAEARAARDQAQRDLHRASKLAADRAISAAQLDGARVAWQAARARASGAKVRVDEAHALLDDTSIRAPMDGIVLRRALEIGSWVSPGVVGFTVADIDSMKAVFAVPDTVREGLRLGALQAVTTEAFAGGSSFDGRITRIASSADPRSRSFEVEVTLKNPEHTLKAGMVAALALGVAPAAMPAAVLPLSAVVRAKQGADELAVYTLNETTSPPTVHLARVELGEFLGNSIAVKAGLKAGEKVVVQGASLLVDRERVRVIP